MSRFILLKGLSSFIILLFIPLSIFTSSKFIGILIVLLSPLNATEDNFPGKIKSISQKKPSILHCETFPFIFILLFLPLIVKVEIFPKISKLQLSSFK